jgi:putative addiction module killer protein
VKEIWRAEPYQIWFKRLKDKRAKAKIYVRIERLAEGNPGDWKPIGDGLCELRIDCGPGYRVYYKDTGKEIILLLCGGDKSSQQKDIARAKEIARACVLTEEENAKDKNK